MQLDTVDEGNHRFKFTIFITTLLTSFALVSVGAFYLFARTTGGLFSRVILTAPLRRSWFLGIGDSKMPIVSLFVKTVDGYVKRDFLIDSGSAVSSVPSDMAVLMGKNIKDLPRRVFKSFGGAVSFAYESEMEVLVGNKTVVLPVVFLDREGAEYLIGRKVFFDEFGIYFNHLGDRVEIRD